MASLLLRLPPGVLRSPLGFATVRAYGTRRESKPRKQRPNRNARLGLILTEDVSRLGFKGQIVKVKHGYGRNYLLPRKKAVYNTEENRELHGAWEEEKKSTSIGVDHAQFLSDYLSTKELILEKSPGTQWAVFEQDLSMAFHKQLQLHVPVACVELDSPIASFGRHSVSIRVDDSTLVSVPVSVKEKLKTKKKDEPNVSIL